MDQATHEATARPATVALRAQCRVSRKGALLAVGGLIGGILIAVILTLIAGAGGPTAKDIEHAAMRKVLAEVKTSIDAQYSLIALTQGPQAATEARKKVDEALKDLRVSADLHGKRKLDDTRWEVTARLSSVHNGKNEFSDEVVLVMSESDDGWDIEEDRTL